MNDEIRDIAGGSSVHARVLEELLKQLKQGAGGDALAEMARDVLDGRIGLREAVADSYYGGALVERAAEFTDWYDTLSDEEREEHARRAEADIDRFLTEEDNRRGADADPRR